MGSFKHSKENVGVFGFSFLVLSENLGCCHGNHKIFWEKREIVYNFLINGGTGTKLVANKSLYMYHYACVYSFYFPYLHIYEY